MSGADRSPFAVFCDILAGEDPGLAAHGRLYSAGTDLISFLASHRYDERMEFEPAVRWDPEEERWRPTARVVTGARDGSDSVAILSNGIPLSVTYEPASMVRGADPSDMGDAFRSLEGALTAAREFIDRYDSYVEDGTDAVYLFHDPGLMHLATLIYDHSSDFSRAYGNGIDGGPLTPETARAIPRRDWLPRGGGERTL